MDVKTAAGQHIMAGLPGTEIDPAFAALVRECKVGNVILFRRNVKNAAQLARLCASLREHRHRPGGRSSFALFTRHGHYAGSHGPGSRGRGRALQSGEAHGGTASRRRCEF